MLKKISCILFMAMSSIGAHAQDWDGRVIGKLAFVDAVGGLGGAPNGLDLRIGLVGKPALCTGTASTYAYLNVTDPNYKVIAGLLMLAYASGKDITVISRNGQNGACQIGYVSLGDNTI